MEMQYFWLSVGHSIKIFGTMKMLKKKIWCLLVPKRAILMAYEIYSWSLILQNKENFPHWRQIRLPGWWEKEKSNHMFPESCFFQKQPPDVFFKKKVLFEISQNSQENTFARSSFLKKKLWHRCFPVNFAKFLRTPFLQKTSGRLLLFFLNLTYVWHNREPGFIKYLLILITLPSLFFIFITGFEHK